LTSSYTTRKRILKQGAGDSINLWGDLQSSGDFDVVDYSMDGWAAFDPTNNVTLTTANGSTAGNQAGARALKLTTAVATFITTLPAVEGWWIVWNATSAAQTIASSGGGTSVSIAAGEKVFVACDATNVVRLTLTQMTAPLDMGSNKITSLTDPTSPQDAATKAYVDATAFATFSGTFPAMGGNAGKVLQTDGAAAFWHQLTTADLSDYTSDQAAKTTAQHGFAVAMAVAL
jgi:hypothetical protein